MTVEELITESFWNLMHFYPITLHADRDIIGRELVIELEKVAKEAHAAGFAEGVERAATLCAEDAQANTTKLCNDPGHDKRWCATCNAMRDEADLLEERIRQLQPHQSNPPGKGE